MVANTATAALAVAMNSVLVTASMNVSMMRSPEPRD